MENGESELLAKGIINSKNYFDVLDIILQRVHITPDKTEVTDITKIKNKRGLKIYKRMQQVKRKFKKHLAEIQTYLCLISYHPLL